MTPDTGRGGRPQGADGAADDVPAIETVALSRSFGGVRAVHDVSVRVAVGETRAVVGPNGAGKTTLFNLLSGHLEPTSGRVHLFGADVTGRPAHRRSRDGVSRTFQLSNLFGDLTTLDNVRLAVAGNDPVARRRFFQPLRTMASVDARARDVAATFGLEAVARERVSRLAYGQQRVLEIAMAVAGQPRVLLLDEPTAGVARRDAEAITTIVAGLPADLTILVVEHDMEVAFALADRVTVLVEGAELVTGAPDEVRRDPEVVRAYLGGDAVDPGGRPDGPRDRPRDRPRDVPRNGGHDGGPT